MFKGINPKILAITWGSISLLAWLLVGLYFFARQPTVPTPVVIESPENAFVQQLYHDTALLERYKSLGADVSDVSLFLGVPADIEQVDPEGTYDKGSNTILIEHGWEDNDAILLHEYLHYVWTKKMTDEERAILQTGLIALYRDDREMQKRVSNYSHLDKNSKEFSDELFAYYCTESSNGYLTPEITQACNKYINRSLLTFQR